ncbi:YheC/YheD family protein [Thermicanus aegyptius]|uniref:YheC/YheD family endospore coat-associated protein n=1 Tax=Thermicanus aegyptius TaxID=94009 RepID=UPI0003F7966B|nr:YheC/YheD family protein [Thermicanus aegyptius]
MNERISLGIMTTRSPRFSPFPEEKFYAELARIGKEKGLMVFTFFPEEINPYSRKINGFVWHEGKWKKGIFPYPTFVYDRVFYTASSLNRTRWKVADLRNQPGTTFLNRGLPDKWKQFWCLRKNPRLVQHLPPQERYANGEQLRKWAQEGEVILKPLSGGFGQGVLHLVPGTPALLEGRTRENRYFRKTFPSSEKAFRLVVPRLTSRYLIQRYLSLTTLEDRPFDIRLFMQKDEEGVWRRAGLGVRIGKPHHLTSNLHGGGITLSLDRFKEWEKGRIGENLDQILTPLGIEVAATLEKEYSPLFEMGIDIGIDRQNRIWILEVNGKPGRDIFAQLGDLEGMKWVYSGPVRYALYLLKLKKGEKGDAVANHENKTYVGERRSSHRAP